MALEILVDPQVILGKQISLGTSDSNTQDKSSDDPSPFHLSASAIARDN